MTPLSDKIENSLNESRILVLGMQVLIAFELRSPLERRFDGLSPPLQRLNLAGLILLLVAFAVLLFPPPITVSSSAATTRRPCTG